MSKKVTLVGAGLVGSLLSIYLALRGRGWKGLEGVGIADEIRKIAIPMYGRAIHNKDGSTAFQPYGKDNQAIYSVSRAEINMRLMDLAEQQPGVKIHFNERCTTIDRSKLEAHFENAETHKRSSVQSDLLFGSDGAFAASRLNMQLTSDRFEYNQHYISAGYK